MKSVAVYCGSSLGNDIEIQVQARELGQLLAEKNIQLVYGGAQIGLMSKVANAVLEHNGYVIGVIPEFLKRKEIVHEGIQELHTTQTMAERKEKMIALSEGFIALPGGFGTMEELFEVITALQLGQLQFPVAILNSNGYYDALIKLMEKMMSTKLLKRENYEMLIVEKDVRILVEKMQQFVPKKTPKWL